MTTDDTATTIRPGRDTAMRWVKQMQPVRVLDGATGRTTMDEGWVIGYFDEPSLVVLRRDGTIGHWSTHLPWQTTGEPPSPEERAALLSRRDQPAVTAEVWAAENARLRSQLAEARAEIARLERAAHEQGADLWIAEDRLDRLRRQVLAVAEDLERYASDLRWEGLERRLAWTLRQIVAGERPAPETAPKSPHRQDHTQVRGDSRTEASSGADGPWSDAWCRTQLQRLSIAASEQYGLRWRDYDVVGAVIEELAALRARNREWEQTLGDLAARCDSGDIPIRLGERYSVAVLREIDRLRTALNSQGGSR